MSTDTQLAQTESQNSDIFEGLSLRDTISHVAKDLDTEPEPALEIEAVQTEVETDVQETRQINETNEEVQQLEYGPSGHEEIDASGQDAREGLQIAEEYESTYNYLPKDLKEHLDSAGYDDETTNQFLELVKNQNQKYIEKTQDLSQKGREFEDMQQVLEPYRDALAQAGMSPAQKLGQYIAIEKALMQNPQEAIFQLANSYGIDLVKAMESKQSFFEDPAQAQIRELSQKVEGLQQSTVDAQNQTLVSEINNFANATDETGALKYPLFDKIKLVMAPHVKQGKSLEEAYNLVVGELGVSNTPAPRAPRKSVKEAKKAAAGVVSTSTGKTTEAPQSLRDELAARVKNLKL